MAEWTSRIAALSIFLFLSGPSGGARAQEQVLHSFTATGDGSSPAGGLIFDRAGNIYGTTQECDGYSGDGNVFELSPQSDGSWKETVLYTFNGNTDGACPTGSLVFDQFGNLYGTNSRLGVYSWGTVFELQPNQGGGWTETTVYSFQGGSDGAYPASGVIIDSSGNLYGSTIAGGNAVCLSYGCGTVFELSPTSVGGWTEEVLYRFGGGSDGSNPSWLLMDEAGNLYGTAGATLFQLTPSNANWFKSVLYTFTGGGPSGVVFGPAASLFGTTSFGGTFGQGTVFELTQTSGSWTESVLFNSSDEPQGKLIFDNAGNLYGRTPLGGPGQFGTVFKMQPSNGGWAETTAQNFDDGSGGGDLLGDIVLDSAGNLYGTTYSGGIGPCQTFGSGCGVVFEIPSVPVVTLTPAFLVFSQSGSILPITVTNSGTGPLSFATPPAFVGFNSFDFTLASGTTCVNGAVVQPGSSCVINVKFTPLTTSAEAATLSIFDNATGSPQTVPVSGGATLSSVLPNPVPGAAGTQTVAIMGTSFANGEVVNWQDLKHGTSGTVVPSSLTPNLLTASIPFASLTSTWQFQVANSGDPTCGQAGAPFCYSLEDVGTDYAYLNDYPFQNATIDEKLPRQFPLRECTSYVGWRMNRNAGTTNPTYPFFFNTMGGGTWGNANNWSVNAKFLGYPFDSTPQVGDIAQWVTGCGGSCAGGHVAYVEAVNQKNGTLTSIIVSEYNYPETKTVNHQFNVRPIKVGSTIWPQYFIRVLYVSVSASSLNFGNQTVGTASNLSVTVTNPGAAAVSVTSIKVMGTNKSDFAQTNTCGSSIPAGGTCGITVTFTPSAIGARSAEVTITDVAGPQINQTVTLTGTGQ